MGGEEGSTGDEGEYGDYGDYGDYGEEGEYGEYGEEGSTVDEGEYGDYGDYGEEGSGDGDDYGDCVDGESCWYDDPEQYENYMNSITNGTGLAQIKAREGELDLDALNNVDWDAYPDFATFCDFDNMDECDLDGYAEAVCDWMEKNFA